MPKDKALVGAAGVHYVAFKLSSLEIAIGLAAPGVKDVDLLATNTKTGKSIAIQVKTMTQASVKSPKWGPYWKWRVGKRIAGAGPKSGFFLAFVDLRGQVPGASVPPDVFIVPSTDLKAPLLEVYPEPPKGPPTDFWCVIYQKDVPSYMNRWDLIEAALA